MTSDLVYVPNVRAVSDGLALVCELPDKRRIGVPKAWIELESEVRDPGDYGTLVIPRDLAHNLGLVGDAL